MPIPIAIAGGQNKVQMCLERFKYDNAVNYKSTSFSSDLSKACQKGIDVYFDNVAGPISDEVMKHLNVGARIVICGTASVSNWVPTPEGPRVERQLLVKRARIQGFVIFDHKDYYAKARQELVIPRGNPVSCYIRSPNSQYPSGSCYIQPERRNVVNAD